MLLMCLNVLLLVHTATEKKSVVQLIGFLFEAAPCFESRLQPHCQEMIKWWQTFEGDLCPFGGARPPHESEAQSSGWHRHLRIFEGDDRPFMSRDALRFVERHGPSEFQREPYAAELLGLITPDLQRYLTDKQQRDQRHRWSRRID